MAETLQLAVLLRNQRAARSLSEAALGRLFGMVQHKAEKLGGLAPGSQALMPTPLYQQNNVR